jgi:hypothetical protein
VRISIVLLVFVLSGAPAAGLVCDVVLCARPPQATTASGCHDHTASGARDVVSAAPERCTHLSLLDPFMPAATRVATSPEASAVFASPVAADMVAFGPSALFERWHGPPRASRIPASTPLRI